MLDQFLREGLVVPRFDTFFDSFFDGRRLCNLLETEYAYLVQLPLMGIDPEKVMIQVVGTQLTIKGTYVVPEIENATYLWHGLMGEEFTQVFTLPAEVEGEKAEASYHFGILTVKIPKAAHIIPKPVKVVVK
jgi:HSP20 family protein